MFGETKEERVDIDMIRNLEAGTNIKIFPDTFEESLEEPAEANKIDTNEEPKLLFPPKSKSGALCTAIMTEGEDPLVDEVINAMQIWTESKMNRIMANLGQKIGMKLTRAAFAVMIKMGGKLSQFSDLVEDFDDQLQDVVQEPAQERKA